MVAQAMNAEYRIISQSGWGVLTGWDNNPHSNIPEYYEKICGVLAGERNKVLGAFEENGFTAWQPDVVVVNLGSNDGNSFNAPEWKDEVTGETFKQKSNADGTFNEEDLESFEKAVMNFLIKLRKYNKNAYIIWAYGMVGTTMMPAINCAVDMYIKKTGDKKVSAIQLIDTTEETAGARSHPGILVHEKSAKILTEYIKEIL